MSILIKNALLIATMDPNDTIIKGGDLYIENNLIKDIGVNLQYKADNIIDADGKIVLPGFINTHHHLYQTLNRNIPHVQDVKLFDWLVALYEIWKNLTPEWVRISTQVGLGELLLTGCTTSTDHFYVFPKNQPKTLFDDLIAGAKKVGIRFHPCRGSMSRGKSKGGLPPDDVVQNEEEILEDSIRVIEKYHNPSYASMCQIALAPCSPFSVTDKLLLETVRLARQYKVRCHTHLAETMDEEKFCLEVHKKRPLEYMESVEWLGDDIWYAHAVYMNDLDIKKMAQTKTGVAHCPSSNLRLGSGIAPIPAMLKNKVPVGIAVDGSASNDSSNMLKELQLTLLIHRVGTSVDAMPAKNVFKMATLGGAQILGRNDIGSLEIGKAADVVIFNMNKLAYAGAMHDPLAALLFAGYDQRTDITIVNGKIVVKDGKLCTVDEEKLINEANKIAKQMVNGG